MQPFGNNRHGPKIGGIVVLLGAGSPSNILWTGPRPASVPSGILVHPAVCPQRTWTENGGYVPFWGWGVAGSPSNTMWPRPTVLPCFILIHPTVSPQYANIAGRQDRQTDRQDNGPIAYGEPFYKRSPKNDYSWISKGTLTTTWGWGGYTIQLLMKNFLRSSRRPTKKSLKSVNYWFWQSYSENKNVAILLTFWDTVYVVAYIQQKMSVFQQIISTLHLAMPDTDRDTVKTVEDTVMRHETWRDMTRHGNSWQSQDKTYKCWDWAKTETWKIMSRDSLETRHVSWESITVSTYM